MWIELSASELPVMRLSDILSVSRIEVVPEMGAQLDKLGALRRLSELLVKELPVDAGRLTQLLQDRERLQSTGIGDGVAVPHAVVEEAPAQTAALLLSSGGVPFDSVDGEPARILFAVVGPRRLAGEHLKTLARISRLLRSAETRSRLLELQRADDAFAFVVERDRALV